MPEKNFVTSSHSNNHIFDDKTKKIDNLKKRKTNSTNIDKYDSLSKNRNDKQ